MDTVFAMRRNQRLHVLFVASRMTLLKTKKDFWEKYAVLVAKKICTLYRKFIKNNISITLVISYLCHAEHACKRRNHRRIYSWRARTSGREFLPWWMVWRENENQAIDSRYHNVNVAGWLPVPVHRRAHAVSLPTCHAARHARVFTGYDSMMYDSYHRGIGSRFLYFFFCNRFPSFTR